MFTQRATTTVVLLAVGGCRSVIPEQALSRPPAAEVTPAAAAPQDRWVPSSPHRRQAYALDQAAVLEIHGDSIPVVDSVAVHARLAFATSERPRSVFGSLLEFTVRNGVHAPATPVEVPLPLAFEADYLAGAHQPDLPDSAVESPCSNATSSIHPVLPRPLDSTSRYAPCRRNLERQYIIFHLPVWNSIARDGLARVLGHRRWRQWREGRAEAEPQCTNEHRRAWGAGRGTRERLRFRIRSTPLRT